MKKKIVLPVLLALMSSPAMAEVIDNQIVMDLVRAGLGNDAIIAKIATSETTFNTDTTALIALSEAGVASDVIAAMITAGSTPQVQAAPAFSMDSPDPSVPHYPGVYILADWLPDPRMQVIDATISNQTRTGGFLGYALTGGIASMSFRTAIPSRAARVVTQNHRPTFYFYFDQATSAPSGGARDGFWMSGAVNSPAVFSLVQFEVKRDRREARVGSFNIAGARSGVMEEDQIPFSYTLISPGVYEVVPNIDLEPGEYGFLFSTSTGGGVGMAGVGAMTARIFDFSIPAASTGATE